MRHLTLNARWDSDALNNQAALTDCGERDFVCNGYSYVIVDLCVCRGVWMTTKKKKKVFCFEFCVFCCACFTQYSQSTPHPPSYILEGGLSTHQQHSAQICSNKCAFLPCYFLTKLRMKSDAARTSSSIFLITMVTGDKSFAIWYAISCLRGSHSDNPGALLKSSDIFNLTQTWSDELQEKDHSILGRKARSAAPHMTACILTLLTKTTKNDSHNNDFKLKIKPCYFFLS